MRPWSAPRAGISFADEYGDLSGGVGQGLGKKKPWWSKQSADSRVVGMTRTVPVTFLLQVSVTCFFPRTWCLTQLCNIQMWDPWDRTPQLQLLSSHRKILDNEQGQWRNQVVRVPSILSCFLVAFLLAPMTSSAYTVLDAQVSRGSARISLVIRIFRERGVQGWPGIVYLNVTLALLVHANP